MSKKRRRLIVGACSLLVVGAGLVPNGGGVGDHASTVEGDTRVDSRVTLCASDPNPGSAFKVEARMLLQEGPRTGPARVETLSEVSYRVHVDDRVGEEVVGRVVVERARTTTRHDDEVTVDEGPAKSTPFREPRGTLGLIRAQGSLLSQLIPKGRRVSVGESWTRVIPVPLGAVAVEVTHTVRVVSQDAEGVLLLEFAADGQGPVLGSELSVTVSALGYALVNPRAADRPLELCLDYEWWGVGGASEDSCVRFGMKLTTEECS